MTARDALWLSVWTAVFTTACGMAYAHHEAAKRIVGLLVEQVAVSLLGLVLLGAFLGCLWLAARWTERPPMTDHLRDEASVLLNRSER